MSKKESGKRGGTDQDVKVKLPEYDPELDPESPEFNMDKWAEVTAEARQGLIETMERVQEVFSKSLQPIYNEQSQQIIDELQDTLQFWTDIAAPTITGVIGGQVWQGSIESWAKTLEGMLAWVNFSRVVFEKSELTPYLQAELRKPEYKGLSVEELWSEARAAGKIKGSLFMQAVEAAEAAMNAFPMLQSTGTPKNFLSPNTTLTNALQALDGKGEVIGGGEMDIPVLNKNTDREVTICVSASIDDSDGITITGKPWTEYDRAIHDAVASLYEDRVKHGLAPIVTADMIFRTVAHREDAEGVSPQQKGAVTKSIEKMRHIYIKADCSDEMKSRKVMVDGKPVTSFKMDGAMLSATRLTVTAGGQKKDAYQLNEPILLKYAKLTGQLFTVNGKLLDIKEVKKGRVTAVTVPLTESRIAIRNYLLRRIKVMEDDEAKAIDAYRKYQNRRKGRGGGELPEKHVSDFRHQKPIILFDTLFSAIGITDATQKTRAKKFSFDVLDFWKATKRIADYKKRTKGRGVDAVVINLQ